jgi:hypothetical protein
MVKRWWMLLGLMLLSLIPAAGASAQSDLRCFPETGYCISGPIRRYWEQNGGLSVFGYPISPLQSEQIERWVGPIQWFERDRLEDHTAQGEGVLAGRLGAELLERQGRPWQFGSSTPPPAGSPCRYFAQTGYSICDANLRRYWERSGGLERFGYPISDAIQETIEGRIYIVQYFERRRMELHPENEPPYNVLLGLLGRDLRGTTPQPQPTCGYPVLAELQANVAEFTRDIPLGCPTPGADYSFIQGASARFERGQMYWVNMPGRPAVIFAIAYEPNGRISYRAFEDTWRAGEIVNGGLTPPAGLFEPNRGFGKVWRNNPDIQQLLGWALENERATQLSFQVFQYGLILRDGDTNRVWQLSPPDSARSASIRY